MPTTRDEQVRSSTAHETTSDRAAARRPGHRPLVRVVLLLVACAVPMIVTLTADVHYTMSDPQGELLVSEQILTNQTVDLDAYLPQIADENWRTVELDGHTYYYFPLGTSVAALPFVAVALAAGVDLPAQEAILQVWIAAVVNALIVLLMILVAEYFVRLGTATVLAVAFWCGSMLASTGATALWSHDFAVLFILLALYLVLRAERRVCHWCWLPFGAAVFMAYLCRPTMLIPGLLLVGYGVVVVRRFALRGLAVAAALGVLLVGFSMSTFGTLVPPYYTWDRLSPVEAWVAMWGNLISPGRGIAWFVPTLLALPLLAWASAGSRRATRALVIVAVAWAALILVTVSLFPKWYGGYAFGPRLLTDALPALFLLTVLVWPPDLGPRRARAAVAVWAVLAVVGVWFNVGRGLHDWHSYAWNAEPDVDTVNEIIWDWRYPQVLHDEARHADRAREYGVATLLIQDGRPTSIGGGVPVPVRSGSPDG